jgi:hypothetical protein
MKRGQAALEFLTTYGWALLIILVMLGAIAYFGILNPSRFLPERCSTSPELSCVDYKIDSTGKVSLQLKQGLGKTIYIHGVSCQYEGTYPTTTTLNMSGAIIAAGPSTAWSPRNTLIAICDFTPSSRLVLLKKQKAKVFFNITYALSPTGLTHPSAGELYAEVQQ